MADIHNRVCIIGAGSSGITAAKTRKELCGERAQGHGERCETTSNFIIS